MTKLAQTIACRAKAVILIGQMANKIAQAIEGVPDSSVKVEIVFSLTQAVKLANQLAQPNDVNFAHRGRMFCELVTSIG